MSTILMEANEPGAVVEVEIRGVYGRELIYPTNSLAQAFANLLGQRTFTPHQIELIKRLGAKIEIKKPELPK